MPTKTELIDLFWRCLWTFLQAFLGVVAGIPAFRSVLSQEIVLPTVDDLRLYGLAGVVAGVAMVASAIKTYVSNKLGTGTATNKIVPAAGLPKPVASNIARPAD